MSERRTEPTGAIWRMPHVGLDEFPNEFSKGNTLRLLWFLPASQDSSNVLL
jgi:hypothetical protein